MDTLYLEPDLRAISVRDGAISVREAGAGDRLPLLLLHGIGSNARAWAGQFADFARQRRVVAWNAPGYPCSAALPCAAPLPSDYGRRVIDLMDALEIERAVIVGQSLGAIMATAAVLHAPDRYAGLVLASPAGGYATAPDAPLPETVAQRIHEVENLGPVGLADRRAQRLLTANASAFVQAIVHKAMSEVTVEGYAQASRMLAQADLEAMAARLDLPVLVIWGSADIITKPDRCARIAAVVPDVREVEVPEVGHGFATEAPRAFNTALAGFLAEIETEMVF